MTQFLFFSGKGGVGKTSMACTTAVYHADVGRRTLIVTTDPASNLSDVFEQPIGHAVTPIAGVPNLFAIEIDADRATEEYKDRALAPIRAIFPPAVVAVMEEQMSGPCTAEVAAFDRFTDFIDAPSDAAGAFDVVIFDTAPTGHTLRLIELPAEWSRAIDAAEQGSGQTCIGPAAAIQDSKHKYERAVATMRDPAATTFTFVLQPEATSIKETRRAIDELGKLGIVSQALIVNGVIPAEEAANPLFAARRAMQQGYLEQITRELPLPSRQMPLLAGEIMGVERLRTVAALLFGGDAAALGILSSPTSGGAAPELDLAAILSHLLPDGGRRTIFFAGKGGVGKTVASCITAVWLARQGLTTLLLTTDPAAHLGDVLSVPVGDQVAPVEGIPNLFATKIDPKAAGDAYKARILADAQARGRSPESIAVMREELDSPCTEEIAAFDLFIDYASQAAWDVIVFDTAPTGHTLRMLELPMDWSKQLDVKVFASVDGAAADDVAKARFGGVIALMRDPRQSTFAFVMYPEATPILEAARAVDELGTLGIRSGLVVANFVLPEAAATTPFGRARRDMQVRYLAELPARFGVPVLPIPLLPQEVKGLDRLTELGEALYGAGVAAGSEKE
ncbi:MAG: TRC40/GET3/ArsA family transport-energizing ATPase [Chloroflexales bacterium]|nr:TRC40/GET3/ArsA family transport-energizing ATPase [Chloroflexales bacterium]